MEEVVAEHTTAKGWRGCDRQQRIRGGCLVGEVLGTELDPIPWTLSESRPPESTLPDGGATVL